MRRELYRENTPYPQCGDKRVGIALRCRGIELLEQVLDLVIRCIANMLTVVHTTRTNQSGI